VNADPKLDPMPTRLATWPALVEYCAAISLVFSCTAALVFGVAWFRSGGHPAAVANEAKRFGYSASGVMSAAFISAGVLGTVALVATRLRSRDVVGPLRLQSTTITGTGLLGAVLGTSALSVACGAAIDLLGVGGHGTMDTIAGVLERPPVTRLVLAIATIAVAPGIAEEVFFRGLIQTRLVTRWGSRRGIVATAAAFGLIHFDAVQGSLAFIVGLFLGWIAERFRGIRPSIASHAFNNALFVAAAAFGSSGDASRTAAVVTLASGALLWMASVVFLRSRFAIQPEPVLTAPAGPPGGA
jgi:membrane protease YdiL (CAAX protease family)